jgi:hypothetical protein
MTQRAGTPELRLSPRTVARAMCVIVAVLGVGHLIAVVIERRVGHDDVAGTEVVVRVFGMDGELNAPTWYSASALLFCAGLAALIAVVERRRAEGAWHWALLAATLTFLSLDEAALLHEELSKPLTRSLDLEEARWEYWAWLGPYLAATVVFVIVFAQFLWRLPPHTRRPLVGGGVVFLSGAAGLELVGRDLWDEGDVSTPYLLLVGVEEMLEMLGVTLLAYALLTFLDREVCPFTIGSSDPPDRVTQPRGRATKPSGQVQDRSQALSFGPGSTS